MIFFTTKGGKIIIEAEQFLNNKNLFFDNNYLLDYLDIVFNFSRLELESMWYDVRLNPENKLEIRSRDSIISNYEGSDEYHDFEGTSIGKFVFVEIDFDDFDQLLAQSIENMS